MALCCDPCTVPKKFDNNWFKNEYLTAKLLEPVKKIIIADIFFAVHYKRCSIRNK